MTGPIAEHQSASLCWSRTLAAEDPSHVCLRVRITDRQSALSGSPAAADPRAHATPADTTNRKLRKGRTQAREDSSVGGDGVGTRWRWSDAAIQVLPARHASRGGIGNLLPLEADSAGSLSDRDRAPSLNSAARSRAWPCVRSFRRSRSSCLSRNRSAITPVSSCRNSQRILCQPAVISEPGHPVPAVLSPGRLLVRKGRSAAGIGLLRLMRAHDPSCSRQPSTGRAPRTRDPRCPRRASHRATIGSPASRDGRVRADPPHARRAINSCASTRATISTRRRDFLRWCGENPPLDVRERLDRGPVGVERRRPQAWRERVRRTARPPGRMRPRASTTATESTSSVSCRRLDGRDGSSNSPRCSDGVSSCRADGAPSPPG